VGFAILVGIGIRVYVACGLDGKSWNDAAIVGLMAMHALKGKFSAFYWGQSYMGSIESLSIAPFFALFGVSDLALYLGLLPWYLVFAAAVYGITRRSGGAGAAAIALLLCAFGSPYLLYHELMPIGGYPETAAFGTLLVWLALRVAYDPMSDRKRTLHWVAIGFVAGLAFWTNWLILPYLIVVGLYLLLGDPRALRGFRPWLALAAFALGSLPFWVFNFQHHFATFELLDRQARLQDAVTGIRWADIGWVLTGGLQRVLGVDGDFTSARLGEALFIVAAVATLVALAQSWRSWRALASGRVREASPAAALFLLGFFTAVIYAECRPTTLQLERFLMPMTTVTIPLLALGVAWLVRRSRILGVAVLTALLWFYGLQAIAMHDHFKGAWPRFWAGPVDGLSDYLLHSPIRFGYADYGDAAITTYLTHDQVVVADYQQWRYPLTELDLRDPAIIVRDDELSAKATLKAMDATFSVARIPGYAIYWPVRYDGIPRAPLPRDGWKLTANASPDDAGLALDGDALTRWSAPTQGPRPVLVLDLGTDQTITGLYFGLGDRPVEGFERLRIEASRDGESWQHLRDVQWGLPLIFRRDGQITTLPGNVQLALFPPHPARWLRLRLLGDTQDHTWSIAELGAFGVGPSDALFQLPELPDPSSPQLLERRLRLEAAHEPWSDRAYLGLRRLYQSSGNVRGLREVDQLEAERFAPAVRVDWDFRRGRRPRRLRLEPTRRSAIRDHLLLASGETHARNLRCVRPLPRRVLPVSR
jgi:hypothetical protein